MCKKRKQAIQETLTKTLNQVLQKTLPHHPNHQYYENTGRKGQGYFEGEGEGVSGYCQ